MGKMMKKKKKFKIYSLGSGAYGIKKRFLWFWYLPYVIEDADSDALGFNYGYFPAEFKSIAEACTFAKKHLSQ